MISREVRSLDADIQLYKLETLIPSVIPMKYENNSLDQISYQGAYIRCMTSLSMELIIKEVHGSIKAMGLT
jgi:hypothetical protein